MLSNIEVIIQVKLLNANSKVASLLFYICTLMSVISHLPASF